MGKPTEKMTDLAKKIASERNLDLPSGYEDDFDTCKGFLDQHAGVRKPSDKQIEFARSLAEQNGVEIPKGALEDAKKLSAFIDEQNASRTYDLSEKQVAMLERNKESLSAKLQKLLSKGGGYSKEEIDALREALSQISASFKK
jgi:hypothetical protein